MQVVPLQSIPNQIVQSQLGGQAVEISVFQFQFGLYVTLAIGTQILAASVVAYNLNRIVRYSYVGFSGDFVFVDTQGSDDPVYTGLGSRWLLVYLTPADLEGFGLSG